MNYYDKLKQMDGQNVYVNISKGRACIRLNGILKALT